MTGALEAGLRKGLTLGEQLQQRRTQAMAASAVKPGHAAQIYGKNAPPRRDWSPNGDEHDERGTFRQAVLKPIDFKP